MQTEELSTEKHHSQNNIARLRSILAEFKKREVDLCISCFEARQPVGIVITFVYTVSRFVYETRP